MAGVVVEVGLAHLDRVFDYAVPGVDGRDRAQPGVRVRVRFAGREVGGFVVDRRAEPDHPGTLTPLRRVVSDEVVLPPDLLALAREVARHWAGSLPDVLRLAVPPRSAAAEKAAGPARRRRHRSDRTPGRGRATRPDRRSWTGWPRGRPCGRPGPRCPDPGWPDALARAVATTAATGRGRRSSCCRTTATSTGWSWPCASCWGRTSTSGSPPTKDHRRGTPRG